MIIAKSVAKMPRTAKILGVGLAAMLMICAADASAQVDYVDPTIGNVGILLVPTRPPCTCPTAWFVSIRFARMRWMIGFDSFPLTISSHRMQELFSIMPGEQGRGGLRSGKDHAVLLLHAIRWIL